MSEKVQDTNQIISSPFFVVGPLRSGTTLLRLMIGQHKDISCFGELEFSVSRYKGTTPPSLSEFYEFLETDRQALAYDLKINKNLNYEDLIKDFVIQLYHRSPNKVVGASVHSRIDVLPILWPNAKFIHLLRDPRDVARSCIGMGWVGNVYEGAKYWLKPELHWDILKNKVPSNQCLEVRYEVLVANPEQELTRISKFLGFPYDKNMLQIESSTTYSKPDARFAEQWRKKLSKDEIRWVESKCAELMESRGYVIQTPKSKLKVSMIERLYLKISSRFKRIIHGISRYGFATWAGFGVTKFFGLKSFNQYFRRRKNKVESAIVK